MTLETDKLILRHWKESDAEDLYRYASDPDVGPIAGWPAHQCLDESRDVIRNVFNAKGAYAICLKENAKAIGAIELKLNGHTDLANRDDECEMGFWLGKPFWARHHAGSSEGNAPSCLRGLWHAQSMDHLLRGQRQVQTRPGKMRIQIPVDNTGCGCSADAREKND